MCITVNHEEDGVFLLKGHVPVEAPGARLLPPLASFDELFTEDSLLE